MRKIVEKKLIENAFIFLLASFDTLEILDVEPLFHFLVP